MSHADEIAIVEMTRPGAVLRRVAAACPGEVIEEASHRHVVDARMDGKGPRFQRTATHLVDAVVLDGGEVADPTRLQFIPAIDQFTREDLRPLGVLQLMNRELFLRRRRDHAMLRRVRRETDVVDEDDARFDERGSRCIGSVQRGQRREQQGGE